MKKSENKSLFMEYALTSMVKKIEAGKRKRMNSCFNNLKKVSRFQEFEANSKKIFYKIGFATLIFLTHKLNFRRVGQAFKGIKDVGDEENYKEENFLG